MLWPKFKQYKHGHGSLIKRDFESDTRRTGSYCTIIQDVEEYTITISKSNQHAVVVYVVLRSVHTYLA